MKKLVIPGLVLAASLTLTGIAMAHPTTAGPVTADCVTAQGVVKVKARLAVEAAVALGDVTAGVTAADQLLIDAKLAIVAKTKTDLDAALAALTASPSPASAATAATAGGAYGTAITALLGTKAGTLGTKSDALVAAKTALTVALEAQAKACTAPPTATATSTPAATSTPTATSTSTATPTVIPTPTVNPVPMTTAPTGSFTQIVTVPQGSVDTGGGPA